MDNNKILEVQYKYIHNFLKGISSIRYKHISNELIEKILAYLFISPYRLKNMYVLKTGKYLVENNSRIMNNVQLQIQNNNKALFHQHKNLQIQKSPEYKYIHIFDSYKIEERNNFLITNPDLNYYQKIHICKIWTRPATRQQKKLITYAERFKTFITGKYLLEQKQCFNVRYLQQINRKFIMPDYRRQFFDKQLKDVLQNSATFCDYNVLDSYTALMMKNYVEIQIGSHIFYDKTKNINNNKSSYQNFQESDSYSINKTIVQSQKNQRIFIVAVFQDFQSYLQQSQGNNQQSDKKKLAEESLQIIPGVCLKVTLSLLDQKAPLSAINIKRQFQFIYDTRQNLQIKKKQLRPQIFTRKNYQNLIIWKQQKTITRRINLVRLINVSKIFYIDGDTKDQINQLKQIYSVDSQVKE